MDRDDQIIAAYAAGEDADGIGRRFGLTAAEVHLIVTAEVGAGDAAANHVGGAPGPRRAPLGTIGIVLLVLGLVCSAGGALWLGTYYASATEYPVASLGYYNLAVGFAGACTGSVLMVVGLILFLIARRQRG